MRLLSTAALALGSAVLLVAPASARSLADSADAAARVGDHSEAVELYSKALGESPDSYRLLVARAISCNWLNRFDAALADVGRAVALDSTKESVWQIAGAAHLGRAEEWRMMEKMSADIDGMDTVSLSLPDSTRAEFFLAVEELSRGEDRNCGARIQRARAWVVLGEYDKAIADYTAAIDCLLSTVPGLAVEHYLNRAGVYLLKGDFESAIADYTGAIKVSGVSRAPGLYRQRGRARLAAGKYAEAVKDFTYYISEAVLYSNDGYDARGEAYLALGDTAKAIADWKYAHKQQSRFPSSPAGRRLLKLD